MVAVTSLVTKFVFQGNTAPLANFNKGMGKSILLVGSLTAAAAASALVLARWSNSTLMALKPLIELSKQTGISVQNIQELSNAAVLSSSSMQAMRSTLSSLTNKIGSASLSGDADFSRLGISIRTAAGEIKTADIVLGEVSQRFKELNFSLAQQRSMASSLGINPELLELLGKTSKEFKELREQSKGFSVLTAQQLKQVDSYHKSIARLSLGFDSLKNLIAVGLAPTLEKLSDGFSNFLESNQESIVNGIKATAEAFSELFGLFGRMLPLTATLTALFTGMSIVTGGLAATLWAAAAPILAIAAAITAAAVVIDDLTMPLRGGKSEIIDGVAGVIKSPNFIGGKVGEWLGRGSESSNITQNNSIQVNTTLEEVGEVISNNIQYQLEDTQKQAIASGGGI